MNKIVQNLGLAAVVVCSQIEPAIAAGTWMPKAFPIESTRIQADTPTLPLFGHTVFCLSYPNECRAKSVMFRRGRIKLDERRREELTSVNYSVNRAITPTRGPTYVIEQRWQVSPERGDCNDYAVTKRHELIRKGWPSSALLLAEVVTNWGEHHLVLVARAREGDFVLDNLTDRIRLWSKASYRWVKIQSGRDPKLWSAVRSDMLSASIK